MNGSKVKIREHATKFEHDGNVNELIQFEVITPEYVKIVNYVVVNGKVKCL